MSADAADVVLGTGPLGTAVARELRSDGASVRAVNRSGEGTMPDGVDVVGADLADADAAEDVCAGADVVYFCVNPPYAEWPRLFPPLLDSAIDGAAAAGARLVVAENCYMYGRVDGPLTEDLPYEAAGPKGETRAAMTQTALAAHEAGRLDVAIGRASDFYGPGVTVSAVGERVFANAIAGKPAYLLGDLDALHTYTFVEDFARALVTLGAHPDAVGEAWHVPSATTLTTREFVELVYVRAGTEPRVRRLPGWMFRAVSTFSAELRELRETRYQFEDPFVVDHAKFAAAFGADPTPHAAAIDRTLEWYRSPGA